MTIFDLKKLHLRKAGTPGKQYQVKDTDGIVKTWVGQSDGGLRLLGAITGQEIQQDDNLTLAEAQALFYPLNTNPAGYLTSSGAETDPVFTSWLTGPPNLSEFTDDVGYLTSFSETDPVWIADKPNYLTSVAAALAYQPLDSDLTSWATVTRSSGFDTFVTAPNSSNLASLITDEVGTGSLVFKSYVDDKIDYNLAIYSALGSSIKAQTEPIQYVNQNSNLADNAAYYQAIWLPVAQTLTGVKWYQRTIGSYTADNNNVIGLYTYSGGTLTQVAVTANDGNLWQTAGSNTIGSKAFSATYAASAGLYFIGILYNSSAAVTAPALGTIVNFTNLSQSALDFTNSAKLCSVIAGQTNLPATQAMSGLTGNPIRIWLSLY